MVEVTADVALMPSELAKLSKALPEGFRKFVVLVGAEIWYPYGAARPLVRWKVVSCPERGWRSTGCASPTWYACPVEVVAAAYAAGTAADALSFTMMEELRGTKVSSPTNSAMEYVGVFAGGGGSEALAYLARFGHLTPPAP